MLPYVEIESLLEKWAANDPSIDGFTVNNVVSAANISPLLYTQVFKYLMSRENYILIPKKVLLCPNNHKGDTYLFSEPIDLNELHHCWCGEEYYFDPGYVLITFSFTDHYKSEAKKKQQRRLLACAAN